MSLTPSLPLSEANSAALLQTLTAEKTRRSTENRLAYYEPYLKQLQFHAAGSTHRERLLMAGNQIGPVGNTSSENRIVFDGPTARTVFMLRPCCVEHPLSNENH